MRVPRRRLRTGLDPDWDGALLTFRTEDGELLASAFGRQAEFSTDLHFGVEESCAWIAGELQDGVIDRLGRPWPELLDADGRFAGVLDVAERGGIACWVLRGVPYCAVGQLAGAISAAGHRLV